MKIKYKHTVIACCIATATQAIAINLPPLLFLTFQRSYGLTLSQISLLIAVNFIAQLSVDILASKFSNYIKLRSCALCASIFSAAGLLIISVLPDILPNPFVGLIIPTVIYSIGTGLVEISVNPILDSFPPEEKGASFAITHSFYSWGHASVILISTLFFLLFGTENWQILTALWSIVPICGAVAFSFVPIGERKDKALQDTQQKNPLFSKIFAALLIMILCAGAAEMVMSQWASEFVELGLGISKTLGDIFGPCLFAALMGLARLLYAKFSQHLNIFKIMSVSALLCVISYLTAALARNPIASLAGCALCGFACGILWPGVVQIASQKIPYGGVRMFALLAVAGDAGCLIGPFAAGQLADVFNDNIRYAFYFTPVFPFIILVLLYLIKKPKKCTENV